MNQQEIRAGIKRAREYLRNLPALARYHDTPARATIERGLLVRVSGPDGIPEEMVAGIGDSASVPSPGWYLRAALASSGSTNCTTAGAKRAVTNATPFSGPAKRSSSASPVRSID